MSSMAQKTGYAFFSLFLALAGAPLSAQETAQEAAVFSQLVLVQDLWTQRRYEEALPAARQLVNEAERSLGPNHRYVAAALVNLGAVYECLGQSGEVLPLYERALAIAESAGDPEITAGALLRFGRMALEASRIYGDFQNARGMLQRALNIAEGIFQPDDPRLIAVMRALAEAEYEGGDYPRAVQLRTTIVQRLRQSFGSNHPDVADELNWVGTVYSSLGDIPSAEAAFQEALPIAQQDSMNEPALLATVLDNLAAMRFYRDDFSGAAELTRRALAIYRTGSTHPQDLAKAIQNLALATEELGDHAQADSLLAEALRVQQDFLGPDHPDLAFPLLNTARVLRRRKEYHPALTYAQQAASILERALGPQHPRLTGALQTVAGLQLYTHQVADALETAARANEIEEFNLNLVLATGSEAQKRLYVQDLALPTDFVVMHLDFAPEEPRAVHLALTSLLRRKGRVLDSVRDQMEALRARATTAERELMDQWANLRSTLAELIYAGPNQAGGRSLWRSALDSVGVALASTEAELAARSTSFIREFRSVTLEQVQAAIPPDAVLVELVLYRTFMRTSPDGEPMDRYAAYLLSPQGMSYVDLGDAAAVDSAIRRFGTALQNPESTDVRAAGRELDELVMHPIRAQASHAKQFILSPDDRLNEIPFAALVDENGRYLAEEYAITYVTSGRDLLIPPSGTVSGPPLLVGDPLYEEIASAQDPAQAARTTLRATEAGNPDQLSWVPLPGTAEEVDVIASILPRARKATEDSASETLVKRTASPWILHMATHGFFLGTLEDSAAANAGEEYAPAPETILLQAGLALAGANRREGGGGEDGILTAFEVASLDLAGTELVVLSACQTGVGTLQPDEGVYGLRRALVIAGARSQVMTLWKVEDTATRDFMVEYYGRLLQGEARGEALRHVQLEFSSNPDRAHPFYWAAFIPIGDWRPLPSRGGS